MQALKSVDVQSCARVMGAVHCAIALLITPICIIVGLFVMAAGGTEEATSGARMIMFGIFAPIIYGATGFVFGALKAWMYNIMAKWLGGIEIELQPIPASSASTAKPIITI